MPLSKARRAELQDELLSTMRRLDALRAELREAQAENRAQVKLHQQKLAELRDILEGREGDQVLLPGTETGTVKPKRALRSAPKAEAARETSAGLIRWKEPDEDGVVVGRHGRDTHKITPYSDGGFRYECPGGGGALPRGYKLEHAKAQCELRAEYREKDRSREIVRCGMGCGRAAHRGECKPAKLPSQKGEITRWAADARARKVPTFVVEMTGLKTKAEVVAKFGDTCVFEKGKPCPKPVGQRPSDRAAQKAMARGAKTATAKAPARAHRAPSSPWLDALLASPGHPEFHWPQFWPSLNAKGEPSHGPVDGRCPIADGDGEDWRTCATCVAQVSGPKEEAEELRAETTASTPIPWMELEDAAHGGSIAQIGATEWRVLEVMPDRLVLESKSSRERAWHKEGVYPAMVEVEAHVRANADMAALATQCGACGIAADQPSPGCEECDHPAAPATAKEDGR